MLFADEEQEDMLARREREDRRRIREENDEDNCGDKEVNRRSILIFLEVLLLKRTF